MRRELAGLILVLAVGGAAAAAPAYRIVERIPGPDGGWDYVRSDPAHGRVYVTRGASVLALDAKTGKVTPGLASGARLHTALPVNGGAEILVTNGGADTAVFADAQTGAIKTTVPTGKGPDAATFDARSGLALVADHAGGDLTLIDPKAHAALGRIEVGGSLEEVAVDGAGRAFVDVEDKNEIAVVDIAKRQVTARWALPGCDGPTGLAYDPQDRVLIAACDGTTDLVSADDGKILATLPTGKGADGAAYDPKRRLAFVPAGRDGTLSVIAMSRSGGRIVQTLATERSARTLGLDEATGRIYLPAAALGPAVAAGRPTLVPGSFHLLVVAPQ